MINHEMESESTLKNGETDDLLKSKERKAEVH